MVKEITQNRLSCFNQHNNWLDSGNPCQMSTYQYTVSGKQAGPELHQLSKKEWERRGVVCKNEQLQPTELRSDERVGCERVLHPLRDWGAAGCWKETGRMMDGWIQAHQPLWEYHGVGVLGSHFQGHEPGDWKWPTWIYQKTNYA